MSGQSAASTPPRVSPGSLGTSIPASSSGWRRSSSLRPVAGCLLDGKDAEDDEQAIKMACEGANRSFVICPAAISSYRKRSFPGCTQRHAVRPRSTATRGSCPQVDRSILIATRMEPFPAPPLDRDSIRSPAWGSTSPDHALVPVRRPADETQPHQPSCSRHDSGRRLGSLVPHTGNSECVHGLLHVG